MKLVGRAEAISDCGGSKPTLGKAYCAFDIVVLPISDMDRYVNPSIRGSSIPKDYKEIKCGHFAFFRPVPHFASMKSSL